MALLDILVAPHEALSTPAAPVTDFNDEIRQHVADMKATMYHKDRGVGLAANQVGILKRIIVMDVGPDNSLERGSGQEPIEAKLYVFINPVIIDSSEETIVFEEYCMSLPGVGVPVERPLSVKVRFFDEHGHEHIEQFTGLQSRCLQHEIDHIEGKIGLDYLSKLKRDRAIKKIHKHYADVYAT